MDIYIYRGGDAGYWSRKQQLVVLILKLFTHTRHAIIVLLTTNACINHVETDVRLTCNTYTCTKAIRYNYIDSVQ